MDCQAATAALKHLGIQDPQRSVSSLSDGSATLLRSETGSTVTLLRRQEKYDILVVGAQPDCPVPALRAVLETAVLPLSDDYAARIGVAFPERDALRKRIREASVALDVIAKGRLFSVAAPKIPMHEELKELVEAGASSVDDLPDNFADNLTVLNQLQANVIVWSKEVDRLVQVSRKGPEAVLTAEEETVFWSTLDAALSTAQKLLSSKTVKLSLDILARKRRATGFLIDANNSLDGARRKASGVLTLIQGLPIVALRTAEDLPSLQKGVVTLLEHISAKLRISSFSVERMLSLLDSMGSDVNSSIGRILAGKGDLLTLPFGEFVRIFEACCDLFESWSRGFDNCRRVAREAARKKSEPIPPRRRSPLSGLHSHLTDLYDLESEHHAIRHAILQLSQDEAVSRRPEKVKSAYSNLVKNCTGLNHFSMSKKDEASWIKARGAYKSEMTSVEGSLALDYVNLVQQGCDMRSLSIALQPLGVVIDKQFMSSAIGKALSDVISVAKSDLRVLQERAALMERDCMHIVQDCPQICVALSECQLLDNRAASVKEDMTRVIGNTQMDLSSEATNFVSAVEKLRESVNPYQRFKKWLDSFDMDVKARHLFRFQSTRNQSVLIRTSIELNVIWFPRILRMAKENPVLIPLLNSRHQEFSRFSKTIFRTFSILEEALASFNSVSERVLELDDVTHHRVYSLVGRFMDSSRDLIAEGFQKCWDDPAKELEDYASRLLQACGHLWNLFSSLFENDAALKNSITQLTTFEIVLDEEGQLNMETQSTVHKLFQRMTVAKAALGQFFGEREAKKYLEKNWFPLLNSALTAVVDKLTVVWFDTLQSGRLRFDKVALDASPDREGNVHVSLIPTISDAELSLVSGLGLAYDSFEKSLLNDYRAFCEKLSTADLGSMLLSHRRKKEEQNEAYGNEAMRHVSKILSRILRLAKDWNQNLAVLRNDQQSNPEIDINGLSLCKERLEHSLAIYEDVTSLQEKDESLGASEEGSVFHDSSIISAKLIAKHKTDLLAVCDRVAMVASESSQSLYKKISSAKSQLADSCGSDFVDSTIALQTMQEELIPSCLLTLQKLSTIEGLFDLAAERIGDTSFPSTQSTEAWILSDSLNAHFKDLTDTCEIRKASVLTNKESLSQKYRKREEEFKTKLTSLFVDFQSIRNDSSEEETFIDTESLMQDLEHQLRNLDAEGLRLHALSKALGFPRKPDTGGPKDILNELDRVKEGYFGLAHVEKSLSEFSTVTLSVADPSAIRSELISLSERVENIALSSGAKKAARRLQASITKSLKGLSLFGALKQVRLSPPRERDLLKRLLAENDTAIETVKDLPLAVFLEANLKDHEAHIRQVLDNAAGEATISDFIMSIERTWTRRECKFRWCDGTPIIEEIPDLLDELDEHLQALETMASSHHAEIFETERLSWERRLGKCREELELLADVQRRWAHINSLFGSSPGSGIHGLRKDLEEEFSAFTSIHARFSALGERFRCSQGILEFMDDTLGLEDMRRELQGIVRGLSRFLEQQRASFPRFFFLPDDDLLQVLSIVPSNLEVLMPHIAKLFPGIQRFKYAIDGTLAEISSISSKEGELLSLLSPVRVKEGAGVAGWLHALEKALTESLKFAASNGLSEFGDTYEASARSCDSSLVESVLQYPAQVVLLVLRHCFTFAVESSLGPGTAKYRDLTEVLQQIEALLDGVRSFVVDKSCLSGDIRRVTLMKGQLIKELVYQRDLTARLLDANVKNILSPLWDHSIRVYFKKGGDVQKLAASLRCGLVEFMYGWEYLGVGETLVHTELTSRCYLTLCESLRRGFGGSPFGPAGTGKTETVKALGRTLGRFVAVFNCDEAFDAISVGRILAGVCRLGCWVCFDEFNRLSAGILSSTSGQLASVQACIRKKEGHIPNFYGGDLPIAVNLGVGVFVTMNPTYSGRRELPANLQTLFRPCAMSKPDSEAIAEVLLLTCGFKFASFLAKKTVGFFDSLRATVSNQPHYDFGLRSLKTTILASSVLFASTSEIEHVEERSQGIEEEALIRGIEEVVKPKLSPEDAQEYDAVVQYIFTEASCLSPELPDGVHAVLKEVMAEKGLIPAKSFMEKLRQLYWLIQHQAGVMLIGVTGSGKSTTWRVLYETLRRKSRGQPEDAEPASLRVSRSTLTVIDPKLLSASQLYGNYDHITREWTDGLFTKTLRRIHEESNERTPQSFPLHWIIFDGDVDPVWAENLNSVLDDNRILTLPNGEQIPLLENTRILFEATDSDHANPSTISRCGMICFAETSVPKLSLEMTLRMIYKEFCGSCSSPGHFDNFAEVVLSTARRATESDGLVMPIPTQSVVRSVSTLLRSCLEKLVRSQHHNRKGAPTSTEFSGKMNVSDTIFHRALVVSASKALCAGLSYSSRLALAQALLDEFKTLQVIHDSFTGLKLPRDLSDVTLLSEGILVGYDALVPKTDITTHHSDIENPDVVIPTPTTVRLKSFLQDALNLTNSTCSSGHTLLLCGPPGCGKSLLLTAALKEIPNISLCSLSFSSETSHEQILAALKGSTEISKRPNGGYVLHPKSTGYRVVLFCDEVNLEKPDGYGTQKSVSLLRSFAEHRGFWDGVSGHWVAIDGISVVAACNPAEDAGRNKLSPRFLANCSVVRVEQPNPADLHIIYGVFVTTLLKGVHQSLTSKADQVTAAMVDFFTQNKNRFCPEEQGPLLSHYIYSPRELSRWVRGLKQLLVDSNRQLKDTNGNLNIEASSLSSWKEVVLAFCYEARRLFIDRLPTADERTFAEDALRRVAKDHLRVDKSWLLDVLYTSWLDIDCEAINSCPRFRIVRDPEQLRKLIYRKLRVFAEEEGLGGSWLTSSGSSSTEDSSAMIDQFAVTDEVLIHLTRIERILCNPLGHAVLMGAPGTGKKTLARFAAWLLSMDIHQVHSHSSYSEDDFAQDLRQILRKAGVHGRRISLIFDESHAMESGFLEVMNSLLACGDVPGLFSNEERASLLEELRAANISSTSSAASETTLYSEFINRVRSNLHIVFTISSTSSAVHLPSCRASAVTRIEDMSERSPALYNRCTVDWIGDWGKDSLEAVAELKIEVSLGHEKLQIIQSAVQLHTLTRDHFEKNHEHVIVTPRHFLEFIEQLNRIALEKGGEIQAGVERHTEGLRRLRHAGTVVDELKDSLEEKSLRLQQKEANANNMLKRMVEEQRSAEKSKVGAEQLALAAAEASSAVEAREDEVAEQLAVVEPKVEAARDAVGSIRKEYLEELRGMPHPPAAVRLALEGVLMVLDASKKKSDSQHSWGNIRSRMRGSEFISSIVNYDAMDLPKGLRSRIEAKILNNPDFDVERISFASRAAGPLAEWTLAVLDFAAVVEAVEPLQAEVVELHEEREELQTQQRKAAEEVQRLEFAIEQCKGDYAVLVSEAEKVRQEIKESESNLRRSEEMLDSLADEWNRWVKDLNGFNVAAVSVWGNAVLGAAFLAYAGPFDHSNRLRLCNAWKAVLKRECIPFDTDLQISTFLTSAHERGCWSSRGLPTDSTSLENYAILKRSARFPLIVDPTRRNARLIRQILDDSSVFGGEENNRDSKESQIAETSFSLTGKRSFIRALESAMRFGTCLILHDADSFDRAVLPLLGQESSYGDATKFAESLNTAQASSSESGKGKSICQKVVRLGQRDVYLSSSFRMYMSSAGLAFVPRAAITRSNVVSFELSPDALGSSCVSTALAILSPETEKQRKSFLVATLHNQERKRRLEEEVLATVNNVEDLGTGLLHGSLLDNLSNLKNEVRLLEDRQREEEETSTAIKNSESLFQPLGQTAIDIFSVIQRLRLLDSLYKFDTSLFMKTFEQTIQTFVSEQGTNDRVASCQALLFRETFVEIARRLFPRDRLPFASALSLVAISGHTPCLSGSNLAQSLESTLSAWNRSLSSAHTPSMSTKERISSVLGHLPAYIKEQLSESGYPRKESACIQMDSSLQILEASLREPHKVLKGVDDLACTLPGSDELIHSNKANPEFALGEEVSRFAKPSSVTDNGKISYAPVLLCSKGPHSDPSSLVTKLAGKLELFMINISMGSTDSDESVLEAIQVAHEKSARGVKVLVLLRNMHIASKAAKEKLIAEVTKTDGKLPFLLIVAMEMTSEFSTSAMTGGLPFFKILAFEALPSFRSNFLRGLELLSAHYNGDMQIGNGRTKTIERLKVTLSWLHACLVERASNAPVGFKICYHFSDEDLMAAWDFLLQKSPDILDSEDQVENVIVFLTHAVYGSRVEYEADNEILFALIAKAFDVNRLKHMNEEFVDVFSTPSMEKNIFVPIEEKKRRQFIRTLPLEANPEWVHMSPSAPHRKHAREGFRAMEKILNLVQGRAMRIRQDEENHLRTSVTEEKTETILQDALNLPDVPELTADEKILDPVWRFWATESSLLITVVETIKEQVMILTGDISSNTKRSRKVPKLRKELDILCSRQALVPEIWKNIAPFHGKAKTLVEFFAGIRLTIDCVRTHILNNDRLPVNLSGISRPEALITALRHKEAARKGIAPHALKAVLCGAEEGSGDGTLVSGISVSGARWDEREKLFLLSEQGDRDSAFLLSWKSATPNDPRSVKAISLPLYRMPIGKFLGMIEVPAPMSASLQLWRLRGVCLSLF